jgi:hypothetical protein
MTLNFAIAVLLPIVWTLSPISVVFSDETINAEISEEHQLVNDILDKWEGRRHKIKSFKISTTGECIVPKQTLDGKNPIEDLAIHLERRWYIDLKNGRFRRETRSSTIGIDGNSLSPRSDILVYDGQRFQSFKPPHGNVRIGKPTPRVSIVGRDYGDEVDVSVACNIEDLPVFFAIGCIPWTEESVAKTFEIPFERERYGILASSPASREAITITRQPIEAPRKNYLAEYVVDTTKDGAILEYRTSNPGDAVVFGASRLVVEVETEFAENESHWFPSKWKYRMGNGTSLVESFSTVVKDIQFDLEFDDTVFQISDHILDSGDQ